ncbi:GH15343 [Drosophila grimshawi]|uniref:GH15343 n=1 Tax=Drosophila grimshawi TaxID=7222 RepID=B4J3K1_DROGR|nr:GH15343 [Drosophila grimshawi]
MSSCHSVGRSKETARIIIIGSGPSGIAAATRLLEQGFKNVTIFEAEDRIGGRIKTIPFADSVIDLGAQWCHGEEGNVVYQRVKDLDLVSKTESQLNTTRFLRSNKEMILQETANALTTIVDRSVPEGPNAYDGSFGDHLNHKYWLEVEKLPNVDRTIATEMLDNFKKGLCAFEGSDNLYEVSGHGHLEYETCDGNQEIHWRDNGYKTFLKLLINAKEDPSDDLGVLKGRVNLNKRILEINWEGSDELRLRCWNGEILTADHVICTVSLGVLKEQHASMFVPALPEPKLRAVKGLKLGTVNKFFLEYVAQPLPQDWTGINFVWVEKDLKELRGTERFWLESVSGFYIVKEQPRLLQGWIIGEHARYMETLTADQVLDGILWLFRKFLPFDVPFPQRFLRTQWHSNPNFRGSYSFRTPYADDLHTGPWDLESPLTDVCGKPRLLFAGEATSKTHYSTVHGATETGWREADRLNGFYSKLS